jgi:ketosteroid isomerase-like protein
VSALDTVRSIYSAFSRGDVPGVLAALAADVRWTEAEGFPYGGTYVGPNAVLEGVFMKLGTEWENFAAEPERFVAEGQTVIALGSYSGTYRKTGKSFRVPFVHVWDLQAGMVVRFQQHTDTAVIARALA